MYTILPHFGNIFFQVQKPALQTATAVSKPIDGVAKPSMAKPLTKNIIMKPVPECSTPPLLNGAAGPGGGGVGPAPPPPSYENAIIQHKKLNSPTTVPRNISPAITSQQISSPVNPRLPSPPPYPSSQVEQMKQQLVRERNSLFRGSIIYFFNGIPDLS